MNGYLQKYIQHERSILMGLGLVAIGLVCAYMYFVSASIVHVVIRQEVQREINAVHSEIAVLEAEYIAAQHAVSANIASLQGFVPTPDKVFLDRTRDSVVVLRDNQ